MRWFARVRASIPNNAMAPNYSGGHQKGRAETAGAIAQAAGATTIIKVITVISVSHY